MSYIIANSPIELYNKKIVAFGTGKVGKIIIPYLMRNPNIELIGLSNTRINENDEVPFLDTRLMVRNIRYWIKTVPNVTILISVIDSIYQDEIVKYCNEIGENEIILLTPEFVDIVVDTYLRPQETFEDELYKNCKIWKALTRDPVLETCCFANEIHETHKASFSEFKGCNKGKDIVILAAGPSMKYYSYAKKMVHIGVNSVFQRKDVALDYYFITDYMGHLADKYEGLKRQWHGELKEYNCVKFFGQGSRILSKEEIQFPENIIEENNGRRFFYAEGDKTIYQNIEYYPLMDAETIVFPALHFAIYTRPRRIYLVGCDCCGSTHYDGTNSLIDYISSTLVDGYKRIKHFVERYYPDTEIVSINPVKLKGIFRDVYTRSYLESNPEICREKVEPFEFDQ